MSAADHDQIAKEEDYRRQKLTEVEALVRRRKMSQATALKLVGLTKVTFYRWRQAEKIGKLAPVRPVTRYSPDEPTAHRIFTSDKAIKLLLGLPPLGGGE